MQPSPSRPGRPDPAAARWTVIVPLKSSVRGKSRLELDPTLRQRLALAMALDTVTAAVGADGVGRVLAVVEDLADGERLARVPGVGIHLTRRTGLNAAIGDGLTVATVTFGGSVAVLPGDLPSLTKDELGAALTRAAQYTSSVVADRQGTGTTLVTATMETGGDRLRPHYGPGSFDRHVADGAVALDLPVTSGLRRDVDRVEDLTGVSGPRTLEVLVAAGFPAPILARPGA